MRLALGIVACTLVATSWRLAEDGSREAEHVKAILEARCTMSVEQQFHEAMIEVYRRAKSECGYNATRFYLMVEKHGGVETAHRLLAGEGASDGLTELWRQGRLDISVERQVLLPQFASLFTEAEREKARTRLRDLEFEC